MAEVRLENVEKIFEKDIEAVKDFNLTIKDKEFTVFVGPSGCGKTTTLRMIAGLEEITRGDLYIDDRKVNALSPQERNISMVFQNYALYPHMTVFENIAFGLQLQKLDKQTIKLKVQQIGTPQEVYDYPQTVFVGNFIGSPAMNFIKGTLKNTYLKVENDKLCLSNETLTMLQQEGYMGKDIIVGVRPEAIQINNDTEKNYTAIVDEVEQLGSENLLHCIWKNQNLLIPASNNFSIKEDDIIPFRFALDKLHFFDSETKKRINEPI